MSHREGGYFATHLLGVLGLDIAGCVVGEPVVIVWAVNETKAVVRGATARLGAAVVVGGAVVVVVVVVGGGGGGGGGGGAAAAAVVVGNGDQEQNLW